MDKDNKIRKTGKLGFIVAAACVLFVANAAQAQQKTATETALSAKEQNIVSISSLTAKGDLERLKTALGAGLLFACAG